MNKVVYIITTYKCSACKCIEYILKEIQKDNPTFDIKICDFSEVPEFIKTNVPLGDYPTVVFIKDNVIKYRFKGTKSRLKVEQIIEDIDY